MALKAKYKPLVEGYQTPNKTLDHIPNMSTSQLHQSDVVTDDPTARATTQRPKSNDMQSQQRHLSLLSLLRTSFLSAQSAEAGDNIRRHAALICEWICREMACKTPPAEHLKQTKIQYNGCSKSTCVRRGG